MTNKFRLSNSQMWTLTLTEIALSLWTANSTLIV